jgi:hypothetical protein
MTLPLAKFVPGFSSFAMSPPIYPSFFGGRSQTYAPRIERRKAQLLRYANPFLSRFSFLIIAVK